MKVWGEKVEGFVFKDLGENPADTKRQVIRNGW
jgi:hypothetical protein